MNPATHATADLARHEVRSTFRPAYSPASRTPQTAGVGGNTVASLLLEHGDGLRLSDDAMIEYLDAQLGIWQVSVDDGDNWRTVRTDLINRARRMGLVVHADAMLRVLPGGASPRSGTPSMVLHALPGALGQETGAYRPYPPEDPDEAARSITLRLTAGDINGTPPVVWTARPRNKRALAAQRSAA